MQQITISHNEEGRRLDRYLVKALPGAGLSFICKMLRKKNITVNLSKAAPEQILNEGDVIRMYFSDETYNKLLVADRRPEEVPVKEVLHGTRRDPYDQYLEAYRRITGPEIVYEDRDFIFVDKPCGVLSQKASRKDISMNEWLVGRCLANGEITKEDLGTYRPAFANRLDRNTSGLMLGSKSLKAGQLLGQLLKDRDMHKYYLCIAEGHPDDELRVSERSFTQIGGYLYKDEEKNLVKVFPDMYQIPSKYSGKVEEIRTGFRLVREYDDPYSMLLEVDLHTGKSHQIRAQLSTLGHPILGDVKYGGRRLHGHKGQLLHAYRVVLPELPEWPAISKGEFKTGIPDFLL